MAVGRVTQILEGLGQAPDRQARRGPCLIGVCRGGRGGLVQKGELAHSGERLAPGPQSSQAGPPAPFRGCSQRAVIDGVLDPAECLDVLQHPPADRGQLLGQRLQVERSARGVARPRQVRLLPQQQLRVAGQPPTQGGVGVDRPQRMVEGQHGHRVGTGDTGGQRCGGTAQKVDPRVAPAVHVGRGHRVLVLAGRFPGAAAGRHHPRPHHPGCSQRGDGDELVGRGRQTKPDEAGCRVHRHTRLNQRSQVRHCGRSGPAQGLGLGRARVGVTSRVHHEDPDARTELRHLAGRERDLVDDRLRNRLAPVTPTRQRTRSRPRPLRRRGRLNPAARSGPTPRADRGQPEPPAASTPPRRAASTPRASAVPSDAWGAKATGVSDRSTPASTRSSSSIVAPSATSSSTGRRAGGQIIVDPAPQQVGIAPAACDDAMAGANVPAPCGPRRVDGGSGRRGPGRALGVERPYLDAVSGLAGEIGQAPAPQRPLDQGHPVAAGDGRPALRRHLTADTAGSPAADGFHREYRRI